MFIWDSYVCQKGVLCFLIHKSYVRSIIIIIIIISLILHWLTVIIVNQYLCRNDTPRMSSDFFLPRNS